MSRQDTSSAELIIEGCDELKKTVPVSEPPPVEKAGESFGLLSSEGFTENVKVKGQALPTAIQNPRPKLPSDMLMSEQSTNLKNRVILNMSSAWRSGKALLVPVDSLKTLRVCLDGGDFRTSTCKLRDFEIFVSVSGNAKVYYFVLISSDFLRLPSNQTKHKVEGKAISLAIQEPRPKPPSDMLRSEQSTNLHLGSYQGRGERGGSLTGRSI